MPQILVVDDDLDIRSIVSDALRQAGYDVESVCNGVQALAAFRRHRPDAMVLDLAMPAMDGQTLVSTLRNQTKWGAVPLVVISGQPNPVLSSRRLGARAYFEKPLDLYELIDCVQGIAK
jgi:CheY-like chemotaxis protein